MIKRISITLMGALWLSTLSLAQAPQGRGKNKERGKRPAIEQIRAEKHSYLVKELELSEEEAKALMPLVNELDKARFEIWQTERELRQKVKQNNAQLSDKEIRAYLDLQSDNRVKIAEIERSYYKRIAEVLSPQKLLRLEQAHRRFVQSRSPRHQHKR